MEMKKTLSVRPTEDSLLEVASFVEAAMEEGGLSPKMIYKVNIAEDEMYSNIVRYSGAKNAEVECAITDAEAVLCLKDDGAEFNPLQAEEPDITLQAEDREIGGLGILMTRKLMTRVEYRRQDGKNILTMVLALK